MSVSFPPFEIVIPQLSAEDLHGLQEYWKVYEAHREEIAAELYRLASDIPEIRFILQDTSLQPSPEQQQANLERQRAAIYQNEWGPYLQSLWEQGARYAQAGLKFRVWFELISAFRTCLRPHLLAAYGDSPQRLLRALDGVDLLIEIIMSAIGDSYLATKEQLIHSQEKMIQAAAERERAGERLRGVLELAPDPIVVVDANGKIVLVNTQFERVFGFSRKEAVGQPVEILVPQRFHHNHLDHRAMYFHEPRARPMGSGLELFGVRRDGSEFPVEISLSPVHTEDGTLVTAAIRDITDRKLAEEKIKKLNADLEHRALQLEATNKELEAFSYSVSHDLRAPLRTIDGFSQAVLEDFGTLLPDEGHNYLMRIRTAAQRMAQLIDDLLNLSRVTRSPLNPEPTNLSAIAQNVIHELQSTEPNRIVDVSIAPNTAAVCDPRLMKVVLENLLSNAWKFTSKQQFAHIEFGVTEDPQNGRTYFVRDNGAGFDMAYVNKLFGAFQRLHTASEFPGIGIGLAIVQRIINRHGGRVWADGAVNQGAAFFFTL